MGRDSDRDIVRVRVRVRVKDKIRVRVSLPIVNNAGEPFQAIKSQPCF